MKTSRLVMLLCVAVAFMLPAAALARGRVPRGLGIGHRADEARVFRSYREIAYTLQKSQFRNARSVLERTVATTLGQPDVAMASVLPAAAALADAVGSAFTDTNTQVAGVDEADLVKTDGTFLYSVSGGRLAVVRGASLAEDGTVQPLELVSMVPLDEDGFVPSEIVLYGHYVVVVGMAYDYSFLTDPVATDPAAGVSLVASRWPVATCTARTVVRVYDVSDPAAVGLVRTVTVEGSHLATRRIDRYLYVVARAYPRFDPGTDPVRRTPLNGLVPRVSDSLKQGRSRNLLPKEVSYLPDCYEASYLVVAALDLGTATGAFVPHAFLGAGNVVYASRESLYVASSSWFWRPILALGTDLTAVAEPAQETVSLYRFQLDGTTVQCAAHGSVPGRVLNSFSMDESGGVFRIATTSYPNLWTDAAQTSGVYTFDLSLNRLGQIEGVAPGERIYAARFAGDRCYLVTFETIDPLFVIGLADATRPEVLGELTMPGYSAYLHPLDATHLMGFGKDVQTVETPWSGEEGILLEQGLKIGVFDVGDVSNPVEEHSELIGGRGSDSEVLRDHHAFLYDPTRELLAFPCTVREFIDPADPADPWLWGDFVFQGVLAYRLTADGGFVRLGGVTHMDGAATDVWDAPQDRCVRRALLLGDVLHTVSAGMVKATAIDSMRELSALELPTAEPPADDPLVYWLLGNAGTAGVFTGPVTDTTGSPDDPAGGDTEPPAAAFGDLLRGFLEAVR